MSAYKFTKTSERKPVEVSWSAKDNKSKSYLPPGQRKQTVEEAFPELIKGDRISSKSYLPPAQRNQLVEEDFPELSKNEVIARNEDRKTTTFVDKLKATIKNPIDKKKINYENSSIASEKNESIVPLRKPVVKTDYEIWQSRRLYPSSEEEDDKQAINEEPEDDHDSYDAVSDNEYDDIEVYDPSEYDRH